MSEQRIKCCYVPTMASMDAISFRRPIEILLQVRAMTRDELADWWRLYVRTLAGLLELVEGAGAAAPPDALQQLQQLQREALFLHIRCGAPAAARAGCPAAAFWARERGLAQAGIAWRRLRGRRADSVCGGQPAPAHAGGAPACSGAPPGPGGRQTRGARARAQGGGDQREQREALCGARGGGRVGRGARRAQLARRLVPGARAAAQRTCGLALRARGRMLRWRVWRGLRLSALAGRPRARPSRGPGRTRRAATDGCVGGPAAQRQGRRPP